MTSKYKVSKSSKIYSGNNVISIIRNKGLIKLHRGGRGYFWYGDAVDKLAKYESSGITPEELLELSICISKNTDIQPVVDKIRNRMSEDRKALFERIKSC